MMGKFRSKLKRHGKGKTWAKGQSATSNPEQMKHRLKAKSRFFQSNLNLAPNTTSTPNELTTDAVRKHEQSEAYSAASATVNEVAGSLKSCKLDDVDDSMSETELGTFKTSQTFASSYSMCTNMSFKKLLNGFRVNSELHKEMLAILTAITEIIRERGGKESNTEYFLLLMEQIEASSEECGIVAGVALLSMGLKFVAPAVLRMRFGATAATLQTLLHRFLDSTNQSIIRYLIISMSVLLRAQDYITFTYSSTFDYFDLLLSFTIHSKPKIRKAAQHGIISIIHSCSFMAGQSDKPEVNPTTDGTAPTKVIYHPAGRRITLFCRALFKPEVLVNSQTSLLHILALLKDTIAGFSREDIRQICQHLLSIMTAANVLVRTNCYFVLHSLFLSRSANVNGSLCAKLVAAIYEYRPDRSDMRQSLAWINVLKEGYIHLAIMELDMCVQSLPRIFEVCIGDLWHSDRPELVVGVSNCIQELLENCMALACATEDRIRKYRNIVVRIIALLDKALNTPFGEISKYVIMTFAKVFETFGPIFATELSAPLATIALRYDNQSSLRLQIEHTITSAIKSLGPEIVLHVFPLSDGTAVLLERSWILPLMREGANGARLQYFKEAVLPLAVQCQQKWHEEAVAKNVSSAHIHELLCCQLWGLFPGFCRQPRDPEYFRVLAPTLGVALEKNPEFRAPIFDGLLELLDNRQSSDCHEAIGQYARNFLPRLFNIYSDKPNGTHEAELRKRAMEVIRLYMERAPVDVQVELFKTSQKELSNVALASFEYDALFDINAAILLVQNCRGIEIYFQTYMAPVLRNDKSKLVAKDEQKLKKQQRKTYELLRELMTSEQPSCRKFTRKNSTALEQLLLLDAFTSSCNVCQASRLHCIKTMLQGRSNLSYNDQLVMKVIPEAVLNYKELSTRQEPVAEDLIKFIADLYQEERKINDFVDIIMAGLTGNESLITNTIFALRAVLHQQGPNLKVSTLQFVLQQVSVFLVQKSRSQAEAAVTLLITFIKVMPIALVAKQLETIMRSLSAMTTDTKRYCRIQIGYFLKKLSKRFHTEQLARFVPGDDHVTHRRLKKIRKQMRRDTRKKLNEEAQANGNSSDDEQAGGLEQKSCTIDDILADSDTDLPEDMEGDDQPSTSKRIKAKKASSTYIREDVDEIVDLADLKSIGNVLTSGAAASGSIKPTNAKPKAENGGFKTAADGRLIISEKALRGMANDATEDDETDSDADSGHVQDASSDVPKKTKRGMEADSSDEEQLQAAAGGNKRRRKANDDLSMRSGSTRYTAGGKGIHRALNTDAVSVKSGHTAKSASKPLGSENSSKKANGDVKQTGKLQPYSYIPLSRNTLNKRKRAMNSRKFKNNVRSAGSKGGRVNKSYK